MSQIFLRETRILRKRQFFKGKVLIHNKTTCLVIILYCVVKPASADDAGKYCESLNRDQPQRVYQIASKIDGSWKFFSGTAYSNSHPMILEQQIKIAGEDFNFCWAVPAYKRFKAQIVFSRTISSNNQPVSLFRNAKIPLYVPFLYGWRTRKDIVFNSYYEFHSIPDPQRPIPKKFKDLYTWHQTFLWLANEDSFHFLKAIQNWYIGLHPAAERLIRIEMNRPKMSWIHIQARAPVFPDKLLHILLGYSGTRDTLSGITLHEFLFSKM